MSDGHRPLNILFILTDQQRGDAFGARSPWMRTPAIDRLAGEGTVFRRCVTQSPVCVAARTSLMTGLYPHNTGVWRNQPFTLPPTAQTWVRAIRDAGYHTGVVGKTHLHPHFGDLRDRSHLLQEWGFETSLETAGPRASVHTRSAMTDDWESLGLWSVFQEDMSTRKGDDSFVVRPSPLGAEYHYDSWVGRRAVAAVRDQGGDRPWFLWVGFGGPHEPWDAPEPYASVHSAGDLPPLVPRTQSVAADRPRGVLLDNRLADDAGLMAGLSSAELDAVRLNYAGKVTLIDAWVGKMIAAVEERGELERTLIVYASDHGEMIGDHGLMHKSCFFEPAVTVPLVIRAPGLDARVFHDPVELIDLGPTLAEAAGVELHHQQWGRSLWPALRNDASDGREFAVSQQRGEMMVAGPRWKGAFNQDGEIYLCTDLRDDPEERSNFAGSAITADVERGLRDSALSFLMRTQRMEDWF